ncbi:putative metalloprotease with PDZ domain [Christiangramia gaetbulicola]|uniref:Putative metalloprotease with PDZ domain n=1 Tax=Christiangramia gaetbulicola TaxID=703340 RepID=A0A2T6ALR1_9FLAO|nr:PDZ domain-containing protein [Christiangramia gaetbulicola]PTX44745.1 putative metalloprotease with PDZ domain [Christiangramia gaetbulicola]
MNKILLTLLFLSFLGNAQTNTYNISFENAVHHEAKVNISFPEVKSNTITIRMSRTSPGRYALHEFIKNIYGFKATNSKGEMIDAKRVDPYSWEVSDHDGTVNIEYILFANRGDGTYSQIDETHAHLNMPATFMYAEEFEHRPVKVNFDVREDLKWKVTTQLKEESATTYSAPDLYYFMDSPTEISDFQMKSFDMNGQEIRFALHHQGTPEEFEKYFEDVKRIVEQEKAVFSELPDFDYGKYTFLACYMPNVLGDGMEHRNSTILTDQESLSDGGMKGNIGTVAHEFFHAWNVERIRPDELEPFDFTEANMTGSLWFAEGFTSYYTGLFLCRAKVNTPQEYIEGLSGTFNYVWNSAALEYFNPIEMSYQAPFVDAATSVDPTNFENTFVSYYSYGSILGLALDLSLRQEDLNLDDFMKLMWKKYGKTEVAYEIGDIEETLKQYAGEEFAKDFFSKHIYQSEKPDYENLFRSVGVSIKREADKSYFGADLKKTDDGLEIYRNTFKGSPAYEAGLDSGDIIISLNGTAVTTPEEFRKQIASADGSVKVNYVRFGEERTSEVKLKPDPTYSIKIDPNASKEAVKKREKWLSPK